ncbi:MAG: hypothetical protein ACW99F_19155 [Candidatus Hodarchaeales archaeon]|jgi:hypothetical protein
MAKLTHILEEKGIKNLEKARNNTQKNDPKIAKTLFDNLLRLGRKRGFGIEFKTTKKLVKTKNHVLPLKMIEVKKIKRIQLCSRGLRIWVKPIIQNNRLKFFWKGSYIDAAELYGESINKYQD